MKILIAGAGLIGVSSAYFLAKDGHDVTVFDRQPNVAMETSFANGGQISVSYSEPWASAENLKKIVQWMGKEDAPLLYRPKVDWRQWAWGSEFLFECLPWRYQDNVQKMLQIASFSRDTLKSLREDNGHEYKALANGILTYYRTKEGLAHGIAAAQTAQQAGIKRIIKTQQECLTLESKLNGATFQIEGGDYTQDDENGDAHEWATLIAKEVFPHGLNFSQAKFWTGLRPATPGNAPLIGRKKYHSLFVNSGHGTLGWTMAAGSGRILAGMVAGLSTVNKAIKDSLKKDFI